MTEIDPKIRVVLADDHPVVLAGIKALLASAPEVVMVGEASDGRQALSIICDQKPDIAVVDLSMPGLGGAELAKAIMADAPSVRIIALTVHESHAYVQPLMQAGTKGYLLKRSAAEDLVRAIRSVAKGGTYLDPAIAEKALPGNAEASPEGEVALSSREIDVLRLAAHGFSNKEIASRLDIGVKTVETYKARASEKLGLRTRSQIVRYGAARGWLDDLNSSGSGALK